MMFRRFKCSYMSIAGLMSALMLLLPTHVQAETIRVIAFGDSITAGLYRNSNGTYLYCGATGQTSSSDPTCIGNGRVNRGGYTSDLADLINAEGDTGVVYNWGVNGERTSSMVNRINSVMNATPSDYIAIMGGANDAYANVSRTTVAFNIGVMIDQANARDTFPLVATVTPNQSTGSLDARVQSYNPSIIALQNSKKFSLADQYTKLVSNFNAYHSGDKLHFNSAGNSRMADEWFASLPEDNVNAAAPILLLLLD